jgi:hypothetical protein
VNLEKQKLKSEAQKLTPSLGFPLNDSKYFALNYRMILDILYNQKIDSVDHGMVTNKMKAYGLGWLNIFPYDWIKYKGVDMPASLIVWKKTKTLDFPAWVDSKPAKVLHISGNRYSLTIWNHETKDTIKTEIEAVMTLNDLFRFAPDYWANNYTAAMKKVNEMHESIALMADMYRSAKVDQFGIYNYDRLMKEENKVEMLVNFNFQGVDADELSQIEEVVFVPSEGRSLIKLDKANWTKVAMVPDKGGKLFALLPGKKLAIYNVPKYAAIDFENIKKMAKPEYAFAMENYPEVITDAVKLKALILN